MISRQAIHDAIKLHAPFVGLSDKPVRHGNLVTDAGETAFFELQLTDIAVQLYNQLYPTLNMKEIVSVKTDVNPAAEFHIYRGYDYTGDVVETDDYTDEFPETEVQGMQSSAQAITGIVGSFGYSIMDIRRAQMAGVPLEAMKALAQREVMEKKLDRMMAIGSANRSLNLIYGFFNAPGNTSVNAGWDVSVGNAVGGGAVNTGAYGSAGQYFG